MNYYERHLGDYAKDAGHLTMLEHGAYTLLLDRYYTTEQPIPVDQAHRICRARTKEERAAVDAVLAEFFVLADGSYSQKRTDEEIAKYKESEPDREAKRENERERQRRSRERRKQLFDALRDAGVVPDFDAPMSELNLLLSQATKRGVTGVVTHDVTRDDTATQTPDTRHQTPERKETPPNPPRGASVSVTDLKAEGVDPQHAAEWLAVRKAKRLTLTKTAWDDTKAEAMKAGVTPAEAVRLSVVNSWAGFKASWLQNAGQEAVRTHNVRPLNRQIAIEEENARVAREWVADMKAAQQ